MAAAVARRRVRASAPTKLRTAPPPFPHAAPSPRPVTLDDVAAGWRLALGTAADALRAAGSLGLSSLDAAELHRLNTRLTQERDAVARLLDAIAREEHVQLRRPLSAPPATRKMLGLPTDTLACVFDLDGVLTASAELHAAAWADTFDEFLTRRAEHAGEAFAHSVRPFDRRGDYFAHLHGRPRLDGVREFLASRGIRVSEGRATDPPTAETVHGLARRKNEALRHRLAGEGVAAFAGSRRYLETAREAGLRCVVVSASANTTEILERAGLAELVDAHVDGETMEDERLRAKPAPDTIVAACRLVGAPPEAAVAFETTRAGVAAARAAGIGLVVAVDRAGREGALREAGADVVVGDLADLLDRLLS